MKRVLNVGQCAADTRSITRLLSQFEAAVESIDLADETLARLREEPTVDLVLINRKLDRDGSDGMDIIRAMKADASLAETDVMLVTNFAEHQQAAVQIGALPGFGKAALDAAETREILNDVLGTESHG